ncbi:hypothetical protein GJ744_008110 [Endocarpon pusillum]|uniref:Uncharacterized protein n=1 Tax=Endocarpon pusillum TaxID=364733 RepID=A0A8H7AK20_9EURO|nr:hypothetical protein GJ744_008110 [Endocarpon pusillum]
MPPIPVEPEGPLPNGVSESLEPDEPLANGVRGRELNTKRKQELCTICQTFGLSAERFIIDDDPSLRSQKP